VDRADPTHLNDVEVVTAAFADQFTDVSPGDLLLSFRNVSTLAVMSPVDGKIKRYFQGRFLAQHDPDITHDGKIIIFNNADPAVATDRITGSNIIEFDPRNDAEKVLFPVTDEDKFFTAIMGDSQGLPNGNRLVTETLSGRVFEFTPNGKVVWDLVMSFDEDHAAAIAKAERYPRSFFNQEFVCNE
jgi:hypothetical protein